MKRVIMVLLLLVMLCLSGCGEELSNEMNAADKINKTEVQMCVDAGGIPTRSIWDGRLTSCIFPPQK